MSAAARVPANIDLPAVARARHDRRALEQAAEHGVALLQALGLPRLVAPGFVPIDPAEVGDAVDRAIAALDELDAPGEDLEDDETEHAGDDEDTLGWTNAVRQTDLGLNTEDGEHSLGAPERHPSVMSMTSRWFEPATGRRVHRCRRDASQAGWAQGERRDGEGEPEPGYDLPEGDDERCASDDVEAEPSLGWPEDIAAVLDPARQMEADGDREADPLDDATSWTAEQRAERARGRREGAAMVRRAEALGRGGTAPSATGSNLVLLDLRVLGVRGMPGLVDASWVEGRVNG